MEESGIFRTSENLRFDITKTADDGNCLFHAMSFLLALIGVFVHPANLRKEVVKFAAENWEKFKIYAKKYKTSGGRVTKKEAYASYMGADLVYGEKCELKIMAQKFSVYIKVYNYLTGGMVLCCGKIEDPWLCLLASARYDNHIHFDAIIEKVKPEAPKATKSDIEIQMLKSYISDEFCALNKTFHIVRVPGDGNCFFHAASHLLTKIGLAINPADLRQQVVSYVINNWDMYESFCFGYETEAGVITNAHQYAAYMGRNATYAGEIELHALASEYSLYINVYHSIRHDIMANYGIEGNTEINFLFSGMINSGHYEALEVKDSQEEDHQSKKSSRDEKKDDDGAPEKKRRPKEKSRITRSQTRVTRSTPRIP